MKYFEETHFPCQLHLHVGIHTYLVFGILIFDSIPLGFDLFAHFWST